MSSPARQRLYYGFGGGSRNGLPAHFPGTAGNSAFIVIAGSPRRAPGGGPLDLRIKLRAAVLTACPSGKCLATSGESSTRFVPVR